MVLKVIVKSWSRNVHLWNSMSTDCLPANPLKDGNRDLLEVDLSYYPGLALKPKFTLIIRMRLFQTHPTFEYPY